MPFLERLAPGMTKRMTVTLPRFGLGHRPHRIALAQ